MFRSSTMTMRGSIIKMQNKKVTMLYEGSKYTRMKMMSYISNFHGRYPHRVLKFTYLEDKEENIIGDFSCIADL
jgi:hypothetical protein